MNVREISEINKALDKLLKSQKADRKLRDESDKRLSRAEKLLDKSIEERKERWRKADKEMKALRDLFTSQWGRLIESLVEGDLLALLRSRGVEVFDVSRRRKGRRNGENYEFDIIAHNGEEIVVVEVKTTLKTDDVKEFHQKMKRIKTLLPDFKDNTVYGAMAFLEAHSRSDAQAEKLGFFVIKATGDSAAIINENDFEPRKF